MWEVCLYEITCISGYKRFLFPSRFWVICLFIDLNMCVPNPCKNGGQCLGFEGGFKCVCPIGYTGLSCDGEWSWHSKFQWPMHKCRSDWCCSCKNYRAVFKWLSKVITWLRLLRLVIGLKESRQFFNQWESKPKPIAPCTRDFSRTLSELQVIARNCDWFIALPASIVIGRSNCFGFSFPTVVWKPLYSLCQFPL